MPSISSVLTYEEEELTKGPLWARKQAQETKSILSAHPMMLDIPEVRHPVPQGRCGVYFLWKADEVVYVGQGVLIARRIGQHTLGKDFDSYSFIECEPRMLDFVESYHIHRLRPRLNGAPNRFGHMRAPLDPVMTKKVLESYQRAMENKA